MRRGTMAVLLTLMLTVGCAGGCDGDGGGASGRALYSLADGFWGADDARVKSLLDSMPVADHWTMELVEMGQSFKLAAFLRACNVDPNLRWTYLSTGMPYDCATAQAEWNQTAQWIAQTGVGSIEDNVESGRQGVLIYVKCETGQIDEATCSTYYGVQSQVAQGTAQTNEVIIDNIGNKCTVGKDPGCYP